MTTPPTPPALTPEQWAEARSLPPGVAWGFGPATEGTASRHAVAALCLYGQPFGFTQADVDGLRLTARMYRTRAADPTEVAAADWFDALADRIAALLPPAP